jgi:hypothetical protein
MSKPNLLGFSSSVGIYRNKRMRDLRQILAKQIPRKVPFADQSTMCFQALMAYAAENQIDGDFSDYTSGDVAGIFCTNCIDVSLGEASAIWKAFESVGLLEGGKIRSWAKFNRHFAEHEKIVKAKRRAGKLSRQKWLKELSQQAAGITKNGHGETPNPAKIPSKTAPNSDEQSEIRKELWTNKELLQSATGKQKRALIAQREELISRVTGVALTPPLSPAPPPAEKPRKVTAEDRERELLTMARAALQDYPDGLSQEMVRALARAGDQLPAEVQARFHRLFKNPVPE